MRKLLALTALSTVLVSCGPKQLALSSDPVDRAATCAVVSAANARAQSASIKGELGFEDQTHIIHYAMLAGSEGDKFSAKQAQAVVTRMGEVQANVTDGKWQSLIEPCQQAFPAASKSAAVELPAAKFDAQLGCYAMSEFLVKTVSSTDPDAQKRLSELMKLRRDLDNSIGAGLRARGEASFEKNQAAKQAALVQMTNLGPPAEVTKQCTARFT